MDRKGLKLKAKECLRGKWGTTVVAGIIFSLLIGGGGSTGATSSTVDYQNITLDSNMAAAIFTGVTVTMLVIVIALSVIFSPVLLGYKSYHLKLAKGEKPGLKELFSLYHNNMLRTFLFIIVRNALVFLWSLLLVIPGIIARYRYSMAEYLMVEEPGLSGLEAIRKSKELMKGHKGELFELELSFLGWGFLCILTLGIGLFWLLPYIEQTQTQFYRTLVEKQAGPVSANITAEA